MSSYNKNTFTMVQLDAHDWYATLASDLPILITSCGERLGMSMNMAMVDSCLICQVTHNLVATMSNPSLSHLSSVKSIIGLNVSSDFLQGPVTSNIFS